MFSIIFLFRPSKHHHKLQSIFFPFITLRKIKTKTQQREVHRQFKVTGNSLTRFWYPVKTLSSIIETDKENHKVKRKERVSVKCVFIPIPLRPMERSRIHIHRDARGVPYLKGALWCYSDSCELYTRASWFGFCMVTHGYDEKSSQNREHKIGIQQADDETNIQMHEGHKGIFVTR